MTSLLKPNTQAFAHSSLQSLHASLLCRVCGEMVADESSLSAAGQQRSLVRLTWCGHAFHLPCLQESPQSNVSLSEKQLSQLEHLGAVYLRKAACPISGCVPAEGGEGIILGVDVGGKAVSQHWRQVCESLKQWNPPMTQDIKPSPDPTKELDTSATEIKQIRPPAAVSQRGHSTAVQIRAEHEEQPGGIKWSRTSHEDGQDRVFKRPRLPTSKGQTVENVRDSGDLDNRDAEIVSLDDEVADSDPEEEEDTLRHLFSASQALKSDQWESAPVASQEGEADNDHAGTGGEEMAVTKDTNPEEDIPLWARGWSPIDEYGAPPNSQFDLMRREVRT